MGRLWRKSWQQALLVLLLLILGVFLLYPIWLTVRGGFAEDVATGEGFTLRHFELIFADPVLVAGLVNATKIAVVTTLISMVIALPLAVLNAWFTFPGKKFWNAAILVPLILPPFVGAIGMKAILGREGALNALLGTDWDILGGHAGGWFDSRLFAVAFVEALHLYPIIFLNASASVANLDPALDEAAENLGAGPWRRFFKITLPLIRPGLFAGATIVFIWSFTELGTPLIFDYTQVTPVQIFHGLKGVEDSAEPYALTVVLLASAVLMYLSGKFVFGRRGYAMYSKASRAGAEKKLPAFVAWLGAGAFALVTFLALVPHFGVLLTSFSAPGQWYGTVLPSEFTTAHYGQALTHPDSAGAIRNSLFLASAAVIVDMFLGVLIAYVIVRTTVRGRALLDMLCMLPLAVPGLVMAFGYVAMSFSGPVTWIRGQLESGGMEGAARLTRITGTDPNPFLFLIIAYAIRRLPYIVRSTVAGLEQTSGELEEAAVNLGASRFTAVRRVIIPLIMANLIAGGLLVFSFSMLEVSDSLILAQQTVHYPLTKAIYAFTERLGDGPYIASAMGVWGMALLTVTLFGASLLLGKKLGSIFRV